MKVPISWLKDFVDIDVDKKEYADALTMSGSKVEGVECKGDEISNVIAGRIDTLEKHPDADKLQVASVFTGSENIQIVTGAKNVKVGDIIPVAVHGATLPGGVVIKKGKLRGVQSFGMMCSIAELNLEKEDYPNAPEDGIFILENNIAPGTDVKTIFGLNDPIVEFEITSNRPDCLSVYGLARETAVTFNKVLKPFKVHLKEEGDDVNKYASVEIKDSLLCPRYAARIVTDIKIGESPKWIKERLKASGVRPINNIVDITNYVMLELGQPMHAFDLENLEEKKIIVRCAENDEVLKTLDENDRKLDHEMLVIADGKKPVAVAGVMGGANSEISSNTKTILLESANFNGISVRFTAKKLGMRTEASSRFEKGLDIENVITAVDRAAELIEMLGIGKVCKGIIDCLPSPIAHRTVEFMPDRINRLLGTQIEKDDMIRILESLELKVDQKHNLVKVPSFRQDIETYADISEEIARFYGYNNIEQTLLNGKATTEGKKSYSQKIGDIIQNTMIAGGCYEIYTYSFTSNKVFDKLLLPDDSELRNTVVISNPLGEDFSVMRTTTVPNMLEVISHNYKKRTLLGSFYEQSFVYLPTTPNDLPNEVPILTIGEYGVGDFYTLKGLVEDLFVQLGIQKFDFTPSENYTYYHPGRTADIYVKNDLIGTIGEIHPKVSEIFEAPDKTYIATLDISKLGKYANLKVEYNQLPKYPSVTRDIALTVQDKILSKEIEDLIWKKSDNILEEVNLFDVYKGKQVQEGYKSMAYSLVFRSKEKTLVDEEVNKTMSKILSTLETKLNIELRK